MNESKLIEEALAGSVNAYTQLVERSRDGLFRFLLARCANRADAEDALQDTLVSAFRYLRSYDSRWRFSTWLYRIAIRNALPKRRPELLVPEHPAELRDPGADPLAQAIAASDRENIWKTARRVLKEDVYNALWLRYVEDMSMEEIANTIDRSVSWTKVNLLRARRALDAELQPLKGELHG